MLQKVLTQKQTGKKGSFKIAEKKVISQLQNQMTTLEKTIDEKFNIILKSIENGQIVVNSFAQIVS